MKKLLTILLIPIAFYTVSCNNKSTEPKTEGYSITGKVVDINGTSIMSVNIYIEENNSEGGKIVKQTLTDKSGFFSISGLRKGDYTLSSEKNSYAFTPATINVLIIDSNINIENITARQTSGTVCVAVWGDSRENKDNACVNIASILINDISWWDFQVHAGDFTSDGREEDWQRSLNYTGMDKLFIPGKMFMCTSNHDNNQLTWDKYTAGVLPVNSADNTTHFYAHQMGNVHVIMCDSYFTDPTVMQNWLDQYLENNVNEDDWLIGVWHNPCYGDITYKDGIIDICQNWLESLHRHGGDFILHGHAHVYLRTKPLLPDGTIDSINGMVHIINGTGGASWKPAQKYTDKTAFTPDTVSFPTLVYITFEENTATVMTIDARPERDRAVIDEWTWIK